MSIDPGDIMGNYGNASFRRQRERREDTLIIDHLNELDKRWWKYYPIDPGTPDPIPYEMLPGAARDWECCLN